MRRISSTLLILENKKYTNTISHNREREIGEDVNNCDQVCILYLQRNRLREWKRRKGRISLEKSAAQMPCHCAAIFISSYSSSI